MLRKDTNDGTVSPRRRWRFSLRTLILAITFFACAFAWLGIQVRHRQEEKRTIAFISSKLEIAPRLGFGKSSSDDDEFGNSLFQGGPSWLTRVLGVDLFRALTGLQCIAPGNKFSYDRDANGLLLIDREYNTGLTDDDLSRLRKLRYLKQLHLEAHPVTDSGVAYLEEMSNLRVINLSNTAISDEAIRILAQLPRLRELNVSNTDITDICLEHLSNCTTLQKLDVSMTNVTEEASKSFSNRLPSCQVDR